MISDELFHRSFHSWAVNGYGAVANGRPQHACFWLFFGFFSSCVRLERVWLLICLLGHIYAFPIAIWHGFPPAFSTPFHQSQSQSQCPVPVPYSVWWCWQSMGEALPLCSRRRLLPFAVCRWLLFGFYFFVVILLLIFFAQFFVVVPLTSFLVGWVQKRLLICGTCV